MIKKAKEKGSKGLKDTLSEEKECVKGDKKQTQFWTRKALEPLEAGDISITVHKARDIEKKV